MTRRRVDKEDSGSLPVSRSRRVLPPALLCLALLVFLQAISCAHAARMSLFPNLPRRCPQLCSCDTTAEGLKRVLCTEGNMRDIPTHQMDRETQVIEYGGSEETPNEVTIGRIFMELPKLQAISITHSGLPAIGDSCFWPGRQLRLLDLSNNKIRLVRDTDFNGLTALQTLNLSDNSLTEPPSAPFRFLSNLTRLSLARNKLSKLVPRLFFKLDKLEFLDLSENPLTEAQISPETFKDIKTLRSLRMERSQVKSFSTLTYKELPNLRELYLTENKLSFVSSFEFTSLANLKLLALDGNQISIMRDNAFFGLRLVHLGLARNQLTSLSPCVFCNLALESLDISSNKFLAFNGEALKPLSMSLVVLNAANNMHLDKPSQSITSLVSPLKRIQMLRISATLIDDSLDENTFANMSKLISLDVSVNKLSNVSAKLLAPLINLETLDMSYNSLHGLTAEFLASLDAIPAMKAIYLQNNPWSCYRCHILPVMDWINTRSPSAYFNVCKRNGKLAGANCIKCAGPDHLTGKDLHLITELELEYCADPRVQLRLTASEPRVGFLLAVIIIVSLTLLTITIIITYKYKHSAVYYTREDERYEGFHKKTKKESSGCFSISSSAEGRDNYSARSCKTFGSSLPFSGRKSSSSSCTSTAPLNANASHSPPTPTGTRPKVRF